MCTCLKDVAAKVGDKIKEEVMPRVYSFDDIGFDNTHLVSPDGEVRSAWITAIGLPFTVSFHAKKNNGERAANLSKKTANVFMTYCPFCGEKY